MKIFKVDSEEKVKNFDTFLMNNMPISGKKFIIYYYMDGCSACEMFNPIWRNAIKNKHDKNTILIEVEEKFLDNFGFKSVLSG